MKNAPSFYQKYLIAMAIISVPVLVWAAITTVPNNAMQGTAVPPTAFPNPIAPSSPQTIIPPSMGLGLNPVDTQTQTRQTPNGYLVNPSASAVQPSQPTQGQPGVVGPTPIPTPSCTNTVYGEPCIPQ